MVTYITRIAYTSYQEAITMVRKKKLSITLDEPVLEMLSVLHGRLESETYEALGDERVYGPVRYSRSSIVQMALVQLGREHGVEVQWPAPTAMDLQTGKSVPIPADATVQQEVVHCECKKGIMLFNEDKNHWQCTACERVELDHGDHPDRPD